MSLGHGLAAAHLVVTFRRDGAELVSVAMVPGGFMRFRAPDGRPREVSPPGLGWHDSTGRRRRGLSVTGPGPAGIGPDARRRLLAALAAGPRRLATVRGADSELFLYLACAGPANRLAAIGGECVGLVDELGNAAFLRHRWKGLARPGIKCLERYGDPGEAEPALRRVVEAWRAAGRPGLAGFVVRVAFRRPPRGVTWRLPSAGPMRIGVSLWSQGA
jgi:hypothetical protein